MHWLQIIDALPKTWKDKGNAENLDIFDNNIATKSQICVVLTNLLVKCYIQFLLTQIPLNRQDNIIWRIIFKDPSLSRKIFF